MKEILSPNRWLSRQGYKPRWIILHGTAGGATAENIAAYFAQAASQVSSHYVIGQDGEVVRCVAEQCAAWANGAITQGADGWWDRRVNPNLLTISIEHVKPHTDNSDELTAAQKQASFTLIKEICERWNIPKRAADGAGGITGHFSLDPINRSRCPGPYPWTELWSFLERGGTTMPTITIEDVKQYFVQADDQRWRCTHTGEDIAYGILAYYRSHDGLARFGLPLSGEERIPLTEQAVEQYYERGVIVYDPRNETDHVPGEPGPCFSGHIDDGRRLRRYLQLIGADYTAAPITQQQIMAALSSLDALPAGAQQYAASVAVAVKAIKHDLGQGQ